MNFRPDKMLPVDIEEIIYSYVDKFNYWESLPSVSSVHRLIMKSNTSLVASLVKNRFIPPHVIRGMSSFRFAFLLTEYNHEIVENTIGECLNFCIHTASVFWLFIRSKPSIYHGPYAGMFERQSLLFHLINLASMSPAQVTESNLLCLQRRGQSGAYEVSLL